MLELRLRMPDRVGGVHFWLPCSVSEATILAHSHRRLELVLLYAIIKKTTCHYAASQPQPYSSNFHLRFG